MKAFLKVAVKDSPELRVVSLISNGSSLGMCISGIPFGRRDLMSCIAVLMQRFTSGYFALHCWTKEARKCLKNVALWRFYLVFLRSFLPFAIAPMSTRQRTLRTANIFVRFVYLLSSIAYIAKDKHTALCDIKLFISHILTKVRSSCGKYDGWVHMYSTRTTERTLFHWLITIKKTNVVNNFLRFKSIRTQSLIYT